MLVRHLAMLLLLRRIAELEIKISLSELGRALQEDLSNVVVVDELEVRGCLEEGLLAEVGATPLVEVVSLLAAAAVIQ